jgi:hypothetical protein
MVCVQPAAPDLDVALKGIEQTRFPVCSGPPILGYAQGRQDRMSFVTNLRRGETTGIVGPTALPPASCLMNALCKNSRLVDASLRAAP